MNKTGRLKRSESFLGVHFDFHAQDNYDEIGKQVTREMVNHVIDMVRPDYLQCDSKGHAGISSYPTKVGNPAPGFVSDQLKIWREVTAERGIALYVHYSGAWDEEAAKLHPDWAAVDAEGSPDDRVMSVHGPYGDRLMIPQLKELSDVYGVDGVWVDGDWAAKHEYGEEALAAFRRETGVEEIPRKPGDPYWQEFTEFTRQSVENFINKYVEEMHRHNPDFELTCNWAKGYKMPGMEDTQVDYLSADYNCRDSVFDARLAGRCFVHSGIPWDLMAWSFIQTEDDVFSDAPLNLKTPAMLKQEAAVAISLGGGFEAYFRQKNDGSISTWQMKLMGEVATFCRERQSICHNARPVPQIGLIFSSAAFYRRLGGIFSSWGTPERKSFRGVLNCLLDAQNVVDVLIADEMTEHMQQYPLLIYPEWEYIDEDFRKDLLSYVHRGGKLLVVGPGAAAHFQEELGVRLADEPEKRINGLEYRGWMSALNTVSQNTIPGEGVEPFGRLYSTHDMTGSFEIPASLNSYGKGKIAATYLNLGEGYVFGATTVVRDFLNGLVRKLFPNPLVTVSGSHCVDVVVSRIDGKLTVNLVNTSGSHNNDKVHTHDSIPPVGPLNITIQTEQMPQRVTQEPSGQDVAYIHDGREISLTVPHLEIHDVIVVE